MAKFRYDHEIKVHMDDRLMGTIKSAFDPEGREGWAFYPKSTPHRPGEVMGTIAQVRASLEAA